MRSIARCLQGAAALLLLVSMPVPAQVLEHSPGIARYREAAENFDRLAAADAARNEPPRLANPAVAEILRTLTDAHAVFGEGRHSAEDILAIREVLRRTVEISRIYSEFGVSAGDESSATLSDANTIAYQDEIAPLVAFIVDGMGIIVNFQVEFVRERTPQALDQAERQWALTLGSDVEELLRSFLGVVALPGLKSENRLIMIQSLTRNASAYVATLSLTQRRRIAMVAGIAKLAADPQAQAQLDQLISALSGAPCDNICAL